MTRLIFLLFRFDELFFQVTLAVATQPGLFAVDAEYFGDVVFIQFVAHYNEHPTQTVEQNNQRERCGKETFQEDRLIAAKIGMI